MSRKFLDLLRRDGLVSSPEARLVPLTGGVSSEIFRVEDGPRVFVVKRALEKLLVRADWRADVGRNRFERLYLETVSGFMPGVVPRVLAAGDGYFTMEWLGQGWENWKALLLAGQARTQDAAAAGSILGGIHRETAGRPELEDLFDSGQNFFQLRLDPFLLAVAARHPVHRAMIEAEVKRLAAARECLVHGDFSPKNMLRNGPRLVVMDCEPTCYGDAAFDLAFLLTHLLLKALYHAPTDHGLAGLFAAAHGGYAEERGPEASRAVAARTPRLVLLLLLARVDGKSPVEYLTPEKQEHVRRFVLPRLGSARLNLEELSTEWFAALALRGPSPR
ncbi:MAG: phosphotransferase family protein [Chthoniobacterales bacterium]